MTKKQDDEADLNSNFSTEMADAVRQKNDRTQPYRRSLKPFPLPPNPAVTEFAREDGFVDLPLETGDFLEFIRPGIQKRLFSELKRGQMAPEDLLDLHGLRVVEAQHALTQFLAHARKHRLRVVQIIHGKGFRSEGRQPILKQKINQWLRQPEYILAFCSAPRFDGGTGAVYALLSLKGEEHFHHYK